MTLKLSYMDQPLEIKGVIQLDDLIEELEKREPKKRSKDHKTWQRDINLAIDAVNKLAGFGRYHKK